jgi:hypothetical protein
MKHVLFVRETFLSRCSKIFVWEKSRVILGHPVFFKFKPPSPKLKTPKRHPQKIPSLQTNHLLNPRINNLD